MRAKDDQAVLIHLDATSLPDEIYSNYDLEQLEQRIAHALQDSNVGEYDGNEYSFDEVVLYMYGPDAEAMYQVIEPIVQDYPLCRNARVVIRPGGSEVRGREIRIPKNA
ncbi:MAG: hypothetical protein SFX72_17145 [Isosphaeraceae bacterium]|nr:hypothetical protein [Isosphaeraceae bacterium]